jgi:exopolyphosphatase/pppGpp-phosphohydrolase
MSRIGRDGRPISRLWSVRRWVSSRMGNTRHERRVAAIAATLVKTFSPFHTLTRTDVRLLRMAALVHDVGRCVSDKHHPWVGAKMILEHDGLPLRKRERRALAYLTLHHRGSERDGRGDAILRPRDDASRLLILLAFLRAADALDSRSLAAPTLRLSRRGRRLRIACRLREDSEKARRAFSRRKKFRLLEKVLDCRLEVVIEVQRRFRLVA